MLPRAQPKPPDYKEEVTANFRLETRIVCTIAHEVF